MSETRRARRSASIPGGYTRKTLSLPTDLTDRIYKHLETVPGTGISMFMTEAAENLLKKKGA